MKSVFYFYLVCREVAVGSQLLQEKAELENEAGNWASVREWGGLGGDIGGVKGSRTEWTVAVSAALQDPGGGQSV